MQVITLSVSQGTNPEPLLFILFINNLSDVCDCITRNTYARNMEQNSSKGCIQMESDNL